MSITWSGLSFSRWPNVSRGIPTGWFFRRPTRSRRVERLSPGDDAVLARCDGEESGHVTGAHGHHHSKGV